MARTNKKQLLEIVSSMEEAFAFISGAEKAFSDMNQNQVLDVLESCREAAVAIGNSIEELGEGAVKTIDILVEYCELLYNQSLALEDEKEFKRYSQKISARLKRIRKSINTDLVFKKEAVFFPYKASMWDSLESIWEAASKDENCDAYVVPIPYFDRKSDMTAGEMHYEGDKFPEYVPVVDWRTYNVEERKPDVAYIHYPYDEYNRVTSVHPHYYSHKLKSSVETLVYVPYYSTIGGMSEGQKKLSAYYFADYIAAQAEKYRPFFDENLPNEKFMYFGSPKFDKVLKLCKNPPPKPDGWEEKINGRKVYFYNTSLNGFLAASENFLEKMQYVFDTFKGREDAVILWRPHPLFENTVKSMRTDLYERFVSLKEYFVNENIGILDTTPDISASVAWSDAYIGDGMSSVVSLFGVTGKPIFILNNGILNEATEEECNISFLHPAAVNFKYSKYKICFGNSIFCKNLKNNEICFDLFKTIDLNGEKPQFTFADEINGVLYLFSFTSQVLYKIENSELKKIEFEQFDLIGTMFWHTPLLDDDGNLIFLPDKYPYIVKYNTKTDEIRYWNSNGLQFKMVLFDICNNSIYAVTSNSNSLISINNVDGTLKEYKFKSDFDVAAFYYDEECEKDVFWLLPKSGKTLISFNVNSEEFREYDLGDVDFICHDYPDLRETDFYPFTALSVQKGDFIYFAPRLSNKFVKLNKLTGEAEEWIPPMKIPEKPISGYCEVNVKASFYKNLADDSIDMTGFDILLYSSFDAKLYKVNLTTNAYEEIKVTYNLDELKKSAVGFGNLSAWLPYACFEDCFNSLSNFLNGNITGESHNKKKQLENFGKINATFDGTAGEKIHRYIMSKCK